MGGCSLRDPDRSPDDERWREVADRFGSGIEVPRDDRGRDPIATDGGETPSGSGESGPAAGSCWMA